MIKNRLLWSCKDQCPNKVKDKKTINMVHPHPISLSYHQVVQHVKTTIQRAKEMGIDLDCKILYIEKDGRAEIQLIMKN